MTEKRKRWRKSWEEKWRDEASDLLSFEAKALRALLGDVAELVDGDDVGWAVDGQGRPYTEARLARLLSATAEQVRLGLEQLVAAGVAVVAPAGQIGLVGWRQSQEDPSAQRQRQRRARDTDRPDAGQWRDIPRDSHAGCHAQRTEDRGQRTDHDPVAAARADARDRPPGSWSTLGEHLNITRRQLAFGEALVSRRTGIDTRTLRAFEAGDALPTRAELEVLARELGDRTLLEHAGELPDESVVETVVRMEADARESVGLTPLGRQADGAAARLVFAPGEGNETAAIWLVCFRRMAEECRRQLETKGETSSGEFLRLEYLAKPQHRRRYRKADDLDVRRERAPPRGRQRGPALPENDDLPPEIPTT